jgi:hypothetical protein
MAQQGLIFRVLVASPSDCVQERKVVPEIIHSWNAVNSFRSAAILEPVLWETHAVPAMGDRPQALINKQLMEQCDMLIGVFWTRLGTSTGVAESGTAEEIEEFRKAGKPVLLYFSSAPVVPESIDYEQYKSLDVYRKKLQERGLTFRYDSLGEFRDLLQRHLTSTVADLLAASGVPPNPSAPEESDAVKQVKMFKTQFESFLRGFEADWAAERSSEPPGISDAKYILQKASSEILTFTKRVVRDDSAGINAVLQDALRDIKAFGRYEVWMDGGISHEKFWATGDGIIESLKRVPAILETELNRFENSEN